MVDPVVTGERRPARVLIVEDHPLIREGLRARIASQADMEVAGEASSVTEAIGLLAETDPDLALVDLSLRESHGLDLVKTAKQRFPRTRILVLSAFEESLYAERAMRAGAHGYINKSEAPERVLEGIRTIMQGDRYASPQLTQRLLNQAVIGKDGTPVSDPVERLSDRELEVFRLIGQGKTTGAIARQLFLSVHTIDTHREKIRRKLDLRNGNELMRRAVQWVLENG